MTLKGCYTAGSQTSPTIQAAGALGWKNTAGFTLLDETEPEESCSVQGKGSVAEMYGGVGERAWGHIRAAFTTAEWCIPLYTRTGQPSGLTDLKTTVYSTARLQKCEELLSKIPHIRPQAFRL